jgi:hypothetical protein
MKQVINIINQVFEIEKKISGQSAPSIQRNVERIKTELEEMGYTYHAPLHEKYDVTRTDCDANIATNAFSKMVITEVVKPVIHCRNNEGSKIIQKAIVVVE